MRASHSEIQLYADCPVKHHFRYRLRLPVANGQAVELDRGSAVHTGMEYLCGLPEFGGSDSWRRAQEIAAEDLRRRRIDATSTDKQAVQAAVRAGHAYLMSIECQEVLGVERKIQPIVGRWTPNGVIDFIWRDRYGMIHIDDWKSARELGEPTVGIPDGQTALYAHWALEHYQVEQVYAGRVYLRTDEPTFEITQKGKFSQQNKVSYDDYVRALEHETIPQTAALEDEKAQERFGQWWRADTDLVNRHLAKAVLADQQLWAAEIEEQRVPKANRRPKICIRCEYVTECVDRMLHGEFDPTFEKVTANDSNT